LTKTLADQLGRHGITVNLVHPGPTRTERTDEETTRRASSNAIGRIVDAREIGLVVAFSRRRKPRPSPASPSTPAAVRFP